MDSLTWTLTGQNKQSMIFIRSTSVNIMSNSIHIHRQCWEMICRKVFAFWYCHDLESRSSKYRLVWRSIDLSSINHHTMFEPNQLINVWISADVEVCWCSLLASSYFTQLNLSQKPQVVQHTSTLYQISTHSPKDIMCKKMKPTGFALCRPCDHSHSQHHQKWYKMAEVSGLWVWMVWKSLVEKFAYNVQH